MHIYKKKKIFKKTKFKNVRFYLPTNMYRFIFQSKIYPVNFWNYVCYLFIPLLKKLQNEKYIHFLFKMASVL